MYSNKINNASILRPTHVVMLGGFLVILFALLLSVFWFNLIKPFWVAGGFLITFLYFAGVYVHERKYTHSPPFDFEKRLFWGSFLLRILSLTLIVVIAELTWQSPLYVGAVDTARYFRVASEVAEVFWSDGIGHIYDHVMLEYEGHADDIGVPVVLGLLFAFTGNSVIIANLFIAFLGSLSVVLIYRTASCITDQPTARLAGWLAAFMPLSLFFDVVILKEAFVVFLTSMCVYLATRMVTEGQVKLWGIISLVLSCIAIFYFRTAAGAVIAFSIALFFLFNAIRKNPVYSWGAGILTIALFILVLTLTGEQVFIMEQIDERSELGDRRLEAVEQGTVWQNLRLGPVLIILAHFAPFPSMIELNPVWGHDITYYWIAGLVAWNILAWYALLGLWQMIKNQPRQTLMIWGYTVGFTLVLGLTAMFTQVRLGWNVMPMMMIPAAIGLKYYPYKKHIYLSLITAGVLIISWNIFRAIGRGVI